MVRLFVINLRRVGDHCVWFLLALAACVCQEIGVARFSTEIIPFEKVTRFIFVFTQVNQRFDEIYALVVHSNGDEAIFKSFLSRSNAG